MRARFIPIAALAGLATFGLASAQAECRLSDVPLPASYKVARPIGSPYDAWLGIWVGRYSLAGSNVLLEGDRGFDHPCSALVVQSVDKAGNAEVLYAWNRGKGSEPDGDRGYRRMAARIHMDALLAYLSRHAYVRYEMDGDELLGTWSRDDHWGRPVEVSSELYRASARQ